MIVEKGDKFVIVNSLAKDKTEFDVIDAIDRPIRDLVLNINRIGLKTVFSCCGFTYPDEEEPKSHSQDAFIIIKDPHDGKAFYNFLEFTSYAFQCNWKVMRYHINQWVIRFEPAKEQKEYWSKPSLHDYELYSIAIYKLNESIKKMESYSDEFTIIDGNASYHEMGIHWQIKPKNPVTVSIGGSNGESAIQNHQ